MAITAALLLLAHGASAYVAVPGAVSRLVRLPAGFPCGPLARAHGQVVRAQVSQVGVHMADVAASPAGNADVEWEVDEEGEDITEAIASLIAAEGDEGADQEKVELKPVQPYVNEKALEEALARWKKHPTDCGSAQVQVARLSERIKYLTAHQNANKKDKSTERGLVQLANRRRKLLKYLINEDLKVFQELSDHYGIRTRKIVEESLGVTRRAKSRTGGSEN